MMIGFALRLSVSTVVTGQIADRSALPRSSTDFDS